MADTNLLPDEISGLPEALQAFADTVTATSNLIKSLSDLVPNETRSFVVEVVNLTSRTLTKVGDNFAHGGFGATLPQLQIPPFKSDAFTVESNGLATGVSGSVTYKADGIGDTFLIGFDNPFIGSNAVNANASDEVNAALSILGEHSSGNHAHVRFAILDRHEPFPSLQMDWRSCPKCQGMHFAGFPGKGVCPAGGQHDQTGSFAYVLMLDVSPTDKLQLGWQACRKCQGLFFGSLKGVCPAGGEHDGTGSLNYGVRFV